MHTQQRKDGHSCSGRCARIGVASATGEHQSAFSGARQLLPLGRDPTAKMPLGSLESLSVEPFGGIWSCKHVVVNMNTKFSVYISGNCNPGLGPCPWAQSQCALVGGESRVPKRSDGTLTVARNRTTTQLPPPRSVAASPRLRPTTARLGRPFRGGEGGWPARGGGGGALNWAPSSIRPPSPASLHRGRPRRARPTLRPPPPPPPPARRGAWGDWDRRRHCLLPLPALPAVATCPPPPTMIAGRALRAAAAVRTLSLASAPRPPPASVAPAAYVGAAAVRARFLAATASPTTTVTPPPTTAASPTAAGAKVRRCS